MDQTQKWLGDLPSSWRVYFPTVMFIVLFFVLIPISITIVSCITSNTTIEVSCYDFNFLLYQLSNNIDTAITVYSQHWYGHLPAYACFTNLLKSYFGTGVDQYIFRKTFPKNTFGGLVLEWPVNKHLFKSRKILLLILRKSERINFWFPCDQQKNDRFSNDLRGNRKFGDDSLYKKY